MHKKPMHKKPMHKIPTTQSTFGGIKGMYRDVLKDARNRVVWSRDWTSNTIVGDCRRLLAAFVHGPPTTSLGIQGLWVGAGLDSWDSGGAPPPDGTETQLVDPHPYLMSAGDLQLEFLTDSGVSPTPTNRLQIVASLGTDQPDWPDAHHVTGNLREFGLVAELQGTPVLINYVRHTVIAKDPSSTLERTIWLVF